jgi:hypothetical protein
VEVTTPFVDVCQAQVDAVNAAQAQVDAINQTISELQDRLSKAPPAQKSSIAAQIKNENNDLAAVTRQLSLALFTDAKLDLGHKRARAKSA